LKLLSVFLLKIIIFPFNGIENTLYRILQLQLLRAIDITFIGRMDRTHSYKWYWNIIDGKNDFLAFRNRIKESKFQITFMENISDKEDVKILDQTKTIILPSISDSESFGKVMWEGIYCRAVLIFLCTRDHLNLSENTIVEL
jgi:hypothetical protein